MKYILQIIFICFLVSCKSDLKNHTIIGVDLSHHQKNIKWSEFKDNYFKFAYVKSTEGKNYVDSTFIEYRDSLRLINIPVGAYHFFTFCAEADSQAYNFIRNSHLKELDLIPVVDLETRGNCSKRPTKKECLKNISIFLKIVQDSTGVEPLIYTTKDFYWRYLKTFKTENPFWIRSIYFNPSFLFTKNWIIWQFKEDGANGIYGTIDYDILNSKTDGIKNLLLKNRVTQAR